jgi:hypothetical protein
MTNSDFKPFEISEGAMKELSGEHGEYYVYCFSDPVNSDGKRVLFYVGKGKGKRVTHDTPRWQEIVNSGSTPERWIVHSGLTEDQAFAIEEALINLLQDVMGFELDNKISGRQPTDGLLFENVGKYTDYEDCTTDDIQTNELILAVCIDPNSPHESDLKARTLRYWRIQKERADRVKYVVGIAKGSGGIVVSAYKTESTKLTDWGDGRVEFISESDNDDVLNELGLFHRRIINIKFSGGNPVRYIND